MPSRPDLARLFEHSTAGFAVQCPEGNWLGFNSAFKALVGYDDAELHARTLLELVHPEDRERCREQLDRLRDGEISGFRIDKRCLRMDGREIWMRLDVFAVTDHRGTPESIILQAHDTTASRQVLHQLAANEARLRSIIRSMGEGVIVMDRDGGFTLVNQRAADILGFELRELRELGLRDFVRRCSRVDGEPYPFEQFPAWRTLSGGQPRREQVMGVRRPDGDLVWVEISTEPVREDSDVVAVVATFSDVTERRRFERALEDSQQRLSLAVEGARLGMWDWRPGSGEFSYNRILAAMIGVAETASPRAQKAVWSLAHPDDEPRLTRAMERHLAGELSQFDVDVRMRKADGEYLWTNIRGQVTERGDEGEAVRVTGMLIDISQRKLLEKRLEQLATTDELTGLLNRRAGTEALEREAARNLRGGAPFSLVLLDLDGFKQINDSFGHDAGDQVLAELGTLIRGGVRECDAASRWGGEEFALILAECDQAGARALVERLVPRMRELPTPDRRGVTASFGIATYRASESLTDLVKRADRLMYQAKREGRARIVVEAMTDTATGQDRDAASICSARGA